jgi:starvation-inducible outer membrane lipoprotein
MKKVALATLLTLLAACSTLSDSLRGPFAHSGRSTSDAVDQQTNTRPYPAETDQGHF